MDWCLHFCKFPVVLEGFCDANWVAYNDEVSSTSSYLFTLGGEAISRKYAKQTCVARSTMESESIALELAGQEAKRRKGKLWGEQSTPISLHCNSQAAIEVAHNSVYNGKKRHIRIRPGAVNIITESWCYLLGVCEIQEQLGRPFHEGIAKKSSPRIVKGDGVEARGMKRYGGYPFAVKRSHTSILIVLVLIPMTCGKCFCYREAH